jgi:beta-N-acetylhexosaminidase
MTDDISMDALNLPMAERCEKALAAGGDLILHCNGDRAEMDAVAAATPRLAGASLARAAAGARPLRARPFSPEDAAAHLRTLTESIAENSNGTGSGGHA